MNSAVLQPSQEVVRKFNFSSPVLEVSTCQTRSKDFQNNTIDLSVDSEEMKLQSTVTENGKKELTASQTIDYPKKEIHLTYDVNVQNSSDLRLEDCTFTTNTPDTGPLALKIKVTENNKGSETDATFTTENSKTTVELIQDKHNEVTSHCVASKYKKPTTKSK